jgi:ribosomal protein S12 methylthiotransferase accessory factor
MARTHGPNKPVNSSQEALIMRLLSSPKWKGKPLHRVVAPEETAKRIRPFLRTVGVTRFADTTDLDTLGFPIFSAIRPTDMGGPDGISVYNGKGLTKADAKAGAMMEAVERFCGEFWKGSRVTGTYDSLVAGGHVAINPSAMYLQRLGEYRADHVLEWVDGWDLLRERTVLIPLNFVICPYRGETRHLWVQSSNGLASGNTLEEAICHALAELIERDAYTIAMVRAQVLPRMKALHTAMVRGSQLEDPGIDRTLYPSIDLSTLPPSVARLVRQAEKDGTQVWLRNITSDLGIPTFVGSLRRWEGDESELAAGGFGCHPNSTIAAIRAITEAAQGRNVQIQGVREDISRAKVGAPEYRRSKVIEGDRVLWCADSDRRVSFSDVPSFNHSDILEDIDLMLSRLRNDGVQDVFVVDLSLPEIPASVVRAIIPDMESWFVTEFSPDKCILGRRARRHLDLSHGQYHQGDGAESGGRHGA